MKKTHLKLVGARNTTSEYQKKNNFFDFNFSDIFISKKEKIYIIKDELLKLYRDYEISTGYQEEPYFIRAERKIKRIVRENKVNYYFNLFKKFNKNKTYNIM